MTSTSAAVRLDQVVFSYSDTMVRFDVTFAPGEITAIMGPSGAGKSTLLNLVAGFETPREGRVLIGDMDVTMVPPADRPVSMVFQENNLFAHLDVEKNVGLGRSPALRLSAADRQDVAAALGRVGLAGMEKRLPRELSGGERQRVALGRALLAQPRLLLLDEPLGSLDEERKVEILPYLVRLRDEANVPMVYVSHDAGEMRRLATQVVMLRRGRVMAFGGPEVLPPVAAGPAA